MAERLTEEEIQELEECAQKSKEAAQQRSSEVSGYVYGKDAHIDDLADDVLRLVAELKQTREELEKALKENKRLISVAGWLEERIEELSGDALDLERMLDERDAENENLKEEIVELSRQLGSID